MTIWRLLAFLGAVYGQECPENETHSDCGTACEPTCGREPAEMCIEVCVSGCFCNEGFIRRFDGTCVPKENCAPPAAGKFLFVWTKMWNRAVKSGRCLILEIIRHLLFCRILVVVEPKMSY